MEEKNLKLRKAQHTVDEKLYAVQGMRDKDRLNTSQKAVTPVVVF